MKKPVEKKIVVTSTNDRETIGELAKKATDKFIDQVMNEAHEKEEDLWHLKEDHKCAVKLEGMVVIRSWKYDPETEYHFKITLL
jgi:small nuclear ribonucleoprotein (snRNP)-like protein